jgi:hypothetical protein
MIKKGWRACFQPFLFPHHPQAKHTWIHFRNLSTFANLFFMTIKIPIEIVELDNSSYHLFVEGFVNGRRCDLIIDTGASKTVFALNHVSSMLETPPEMEPGIQSAGINATEMDSHQGILTQFRLGHFYTENYSIILIDLNSIDQLYRNISSKSIWGLIGSDFLLKYKAKIDYSKRMLTLQVPKSNFF